MKVAIIEKKSRSVIASVPVFLRGLNYHLIQSEFFDEAWESAVEDGLVEKDKKYNYDFHVLS